MTASRAGVIFLFSILFVPAAALGDDATDVVPGVRVVAPACPDVPLSVPAFIESLRVELANRVATSAINVVTLAIEPCDPGTARVQVTVSDGASGLTFVRDIGLEDVTPEARPRALALAVAELVRSPQPPPTAVPPPPVATAETRSPTAPAAPRALAIGADAVLSFFPSRQTVLWGGRLSLSVERGRWQVGTFADAAAGERRYDVGRVALQSVGAGLMAGPRWSRGGVTVSPGLVGAFAWTRIQGHTSDPGVDAGAGAGLTAAVRARIAVALSVGRALSAQAFVEGGIVARGLDSTVDGARAAGLSGASLVFGLGLAFAP